MLVLFVFRVEARGVILIGIGRWNVSEGVHNNVENVALCALDRLKRHLPHRESSRVIHLQSIRFHFQSINFNAPGLDLIRYSAPT